MRLRTWLKPPSEPDVEIGRQIARFAQREMHALVEVLAGLAVVPDDLIGDDRGEKIAQLGLEILVVGGEFDA